MKRITRSRLFLSSALVVVMLAGTFASGSYAYQLLNPRRVWAEPPTYLIDGLGSPSVDVADGGVGETIAAIDAAWNGAVPGVVDMQINNGVRANFELGDRVPMLNFTDPTGACDGNCLAATFTGYYVRRGKNVRIVDADIVTNTGYLWTSESEPGGCSGEFFIEGVQVHEMGHGLGIGHSNVVGSTMYPSVSYCDNGPATLDADDIAAIQDLYGGGGDDDGGGGSNSCDLLPSGASCTDNGQCCSGKCRGKGGSKTCR